MREHDGVADWFVTVNDRWLIRVAVDLPAPPPEAA
jgi:hypothetical protein